MCHNVGLVETDIELYGIPQNDSITDFKVIKSIKYTITT